MEAARLVTSWFWREEVWLPPGYTWDSFQRPQLTRNRSEVVEPEQFAQFSDLLYPVPLSLVLILLRLLVTRSLLRPLAARLGLRTRGRSARLASAPSPGVARLLEAAHSSRQQHDLQQVAARCGLTVMQVERWLRHRRLADVPDTATKFCETGWRCMFYTLLLCYGTWCLWDKPWLWDIRHCWYDYPFHPMPGDVWCYYMLELSFYWSLSICQFFDVKRKDFWEMLVHHNATILLMMFSWTGHFTRIGTLVMILHDLADPLLELAKMFRYANYRKTCDSIFAMFALVWVVTRCGIYPGHILYSTLYDAASYIEFFSAYYIFNGLLVTLQLLHLVWTYFLMKAIHKAVVVGGVDDKRSDSEDDPTEDENYNQVKKDS